MPPGSPARATASPPSSRWRKCPPRPSRSPAPIGIAWIADHLPELAKLRQRAGSFDLCLLSGVWHHLPVAERPTALATLARLLRPGGRLALSLRLGPDADGSTIFPVDPAETIAQAARTGLTLLHRAATPSVQPANIAAGVTWEWLVLERASGEAT